MNTRQSATGVLLVSALAFGAYGIYSVGVRTGESQRPETANTELPDPGKQVLYWHDPMVPGQRFDKPGKSPFMDMELVPVYGESGEGSGITIDPRVQQNLGIRVAEVTRGLSGAAISAVGSIAYNERDSAVVQARANGFLEQLHVRAMLDRVAADQPLAQVYVPAWVAAQEEFLAVRGMQSDARPALLEGARQRMRLAGMTAEQIALVEAKGVVQARLTIRAPISGIVTELSAREGMTVTVGAPLFRINGLATVWVYADIPESIAAQVRQDQFVTARVAALPGTVFSGTVNAMLPEVSLATRTVKARIELGNPDQQLTPGMFATLQFSGEGREVLQIPSEAVIQTGTRSVVVLAGEEGRFKPVDVEVGLESEGQTEIRSGLAVGQRVVISGQFLVDSEASLKATEGRMGDGGSAQ